MWVDSYLILHNMLVPDHVMGDPRIRYDPVYNVNFDDVISIQEPMERLYQKAVTMGDYLLLMKKRSTTIEKN